MRTAHAYSHPRACKMEILFGRMLNPKSSEAVVELVLAEHRKFDQDAVIVCGSGVDGDSSPPACTLVGASTHAQFS